MKIGVDVRCFSEGKFTGVEEYAKRLLQEIFLRDKKNKYILFFNSWKESTIDFSWAIKYPNVKLKIFRFPNKLINFLFWYLRWPKIDKMLGGVDVFFMPNMNFSAISKKAKTFLTVHDLSFEYYKETFSVKRRLWHWFIDLRSMARKANRVIAISQSTKEDLKVIYGIKERRMRNIPSAISDSFSQINRNDWKLIEIKEKYKLPFKFILFLGTIEPRKNISALVRAYDLLREESREKFGDYKLVIAGSKGWKFGEIFRTIRKSKFRKDIILTGFIDDDDKPALYNLASVFVYPSLFEGFGFPPLEAAKCGTPVIVSNNSSF
ncbi:MAG: putative glycosyltransferase, partial [Candidatus Moranbacteria bacterium GW2011_GWF1_36_4]